MSYLDVVSKILAEVTNEPPARFRRIFRKLAESGKIPASRLLAPAPAGLYEALQAEKSGILNWLIQSQE